MKYTYVRIYVNTYFVIELLLFQIYIKIKVKKYCSKSILKYFMKFFALFVFYTFLTQKIIISTYIVCIYVGYIYSGMYI